MNNDLWRLVIVLTRGGTVSFLKIMRAVPVILVLGLFYVLWKSGLEIDFLHDSRAWMLQVLDYLLWLALKIIPILMALWVMAFSYAVIIRVYLLWSFKKKQSLSLSELIQLETSELRELSEF